MCMYASGRCVVCQWEMRALVRGCESRVDSLTPAAEHASNALNVCFQISINNSSEITWNMEHVRLIYITDNLNTAHRGSQQPVHITISRRF